MVWLEALAPELVPHAAAIPKLCFATGRWRSLRNLQYIFLTQNARVLSRKFVASADGSYQGTASAVPNWS